MGSSTSPLYIVDVIFGVFAVIFETVLKSREILGQILVENRVFGGLLLEPVQDV